MPIRNPEWYDRCSVMPYPISDEATGLDDAGQQIPTNLVVDLSCYFSEDLGRRAYIGSLTVTRTMVNVVLMATDADATTATTLPLAYLQLRKPINPFQCYPLEPVGGSAFGGWITFGRAATETGADSVDYRGRFSSPAQSLLLPSTCWALKSPQIPGVGKLGLPGRLSGLVTLKAGTDIEITRECLALPLILPDLGKAPCDPSNSALREVIVVRLKETSIGPTAEESVLSRYSGLCGGRPESGTCGDPAPIETIAGVSPDCCGNITLVFRGCTRLLETAEWINRIDNPPTSLMANVVMVACPLTLEDVCITQDRLPDAEGNLPNEYTDLCESVSFVSEILPDVVIPPFPGLSLSIGDGLPGDDVSVFSVREGDGGGDDGGVSTDPEDSGGSSTRNIIVYPGTAGLNKIAAASFQLQSSSQEQLHNASIIANYRATGEDDTYSYFAAEVDYDGTLQGYQCLRIGYFNGHYWRTLGSIPTSLSLLLDQTYLLYLEVYSEPSNDSAAHLVAKLKRTVPSELTVALLTGVYAENYGPAVGPFGVGSLYSKTLFSAFSVGNM